MFAKRLMSGLMAGFLGVSLLGASLFAAPSALAAIPGAGQEGYASLHEYVSKTDIPGVYKVTMTLSGFAGDIPATEVAVVIDGSSSMNLNPSVTPPPYFDAYYDSITSLGSPSPRWPEAMYPLVPDLDAVQDGTLDGTTNWLFPLTGKVMDITTGAKTTGVSDPPAQAMGTRFNAALTGAQMAVDSFLTAEKNPGADVTSVGVTVFSSDADLYIEYPWTDASWVGPAIRPFEFFTGGFPSWGYGQFAQYADGAAITYSSRLGDLKPGAPAADVGNAYWAYKIPFQDFDGNPAGNPAFATEPGALAAKWLVDRPFVRYMHALQTGTEKSGGTKLPETEIPDLALRGMMTYDSAGKGKNLLKKDLENVLASTSGAGTIIRGGLEEAHLMFDGRGSAALLGINTGVPTPALISNLTPYNNTTGEESRRFVIFLSDLEDEEDPYDTFTIIDAMKRNGVEFMVIGIDTEGANLGGAPNALNDLGAVDGTTKPHPGKQLYDYHQLSSGDSDPAVTGDYSLYGVWMGTKLTDDALDLVPGNGHLNWASVEQLYAGVGAKQGYDAWTGETANYKYARTADEIKLAFQEYVNDIIFFGKDAMGALKINTSAYELYNYPGKPMYETTGTAGQKVTISGSSISWDMNGGIPLTTSNTLTFYVKMHDDLDKSLYYPVLDKGGFSCYGPFPDSDNPSGQHPNGGWPDRLINTSWSTAYVSPSGDITEGDGTGIEGGLGSGSGSGSGSGNVGSDPSSTQTGGQGHQDNRQMAKEAASMTSVGSVYNVKPVINGISEKTNAAGKKQLSIEVGNGMRMRYQWQYFDEATQSWIDIFGANSSTYTLAKGLFKPSQSYKLRCVITNGAGVKTISEIVTVKMDGKSKSSGLQSRS